MFYHQKNWVFFPLPAAAAGSASNPNNRPTLYRLPQVLRGEDKKRKEEIQWQINSLIQ
jgi:hypothetical protein